LYRLWELVLLLISYMYKFPRTLPVFSCSWQCPSSAHYTLSSIVCVLFFLCIFFRLCFTMNKINTLTHEFYIQLHEVFVIIFCSFNQSFSPNCRVFQQTINMHSSIFASCCFSSCIYMYICIPYSHFCLVEIPLVFLHKRLILKSLTVSQWYIVVQVTHPFAISLSLHTTDWTHPAFQGLLLRFSLSLHNATDKYMGFFTSLCHCYTQFKKNNNWPSQNLNPTNPTALELMRMSS